MASESHDDQLHFVLIPLMSPGHLIPMADNAKLLAERGVVVTIVTTPLNAIRIKPIIDRSIDSGLPIQLVQFSLPLQEFGLPEGCENMDSVPSRKLFWNFFAAVEKLQEPVEKFLETMKPNPSCIIADKYMAWTANIARKFRIPRLLFDGTSCFALLCSHNIQEHKVLESVSGSEPFLVPGLPDEIEVTKSQLPGNMNPGSEDFSSLHDKVKESEEGAYGIVQVLKIGESVGAKVAIPLGEKEISKVLVKRVEFKEAIDKVMIKEGKEGEDRRKRARELAVLAKKATEGGGSSYLNMTLLIEDIRSCKANN